MFHYIVFVEKNKEQSYSEFFATLQKVNKGNNIQALNKKNHLDYNLWSRKKCESGIISELLPVIMDFCGLWPKQCLYSTKLQQQQWQDNGDNKL